MVEVLTVEQADPATSSQSKSGVHAVVLCVFLDANGFMISSRLSLLSKLVVRITFNYVLCGMSVSNTF